MAKTGVLIVNLGTPDSYQRSDVKKYLAEFLMDGRVIDIPYWKRFLLVRGIIAPFRSKKVAVEYQKLWTDKGSPLLVYGQSLVKKLQTVMDQNKDEVLVSLAMRYQSPSIEAGLEALKKGGVDRIVVFPLFPQYASATIGSVAQRVMEVVGAWNVIPSIDFINDYHDHPAFISAFAQKVQHDIKTFAPDHVLFSYHGIPERHLRNMQHQNKELCGFPSCGCGKTDDVKRFCYRSACYNTTRLITNEVGLQADRFTTSYQSRLGKNPWIQPYTDQTVQQLADKGVKRLLVVSPSFVADCLETTLEIGEQYKELFLEHGGEDFAFTKSLNDEDAWVDAIYQMLRAKV